ncbi:hypothetical protein [Pseudomonas gingeri]|uniref:Uncharacterized protein n=1 Tax=Pseudomonas gingeri TaxID=117681 RepID=A0A7Y8CI04_9PSED|nr:hypothetical protein [Pseudomonas gingeri]NWB27290.1 hypothetical protein [Pseudomonas gingeri]NWC31713.1 hypothetical protein [Pseudomonas gingeri]
MTQTAVPVQLAARIAKLAEPAPRRIIFNVCSSNELHIRRILANFKQSVRRIYGQQSYNTMWFRCKDGSITVAIAGTRAVIAHVELFLAHGRMSGLFESGVIVYEGMGVRSFEAHVGRQLRQYVTTQVSHSFGGTNP